jgi:glycosyltransferase involved in cell wall biosynthesis
MAPSPHVLIIVQNLPVPLDRRVWLECQALVRRGSQVSVICPKGPDDPARQMIDGVDIFKYRPAPEAKGLPGYVIEFVYSWARTAWLSRAVWRTRHFDVIQACNPPDTYWLLARLWRRRGVKFVFDQHDLNPELFLSRFGEPKTLRERLEYKGLRWLERMTYRTADRVISTNESYRTKALTRGGHRPENVTVVRSGPDTRLMRPIYPDPAISPEGSFLLVYLGIMGPQDGVYLVLEVMDELVNRRGRTDVRAALLGFGDCLEGLKQRAHDLGLDDLVTFTGRADKNMIANYLSAADVGICPDLKTPLNDVSTMNKTMEYMAYALPSVSFDLIETQVSGGDTVVYVQSGDVQGFTDEVERLLDDPGLRSKLGMSARHRVVDELDWRPQSERFVRVYDELFFDAESIEHGGGSADLMNVAEFDAVGRRYVNTEDPDEFARYIVERRAPEPAVAAVSERRMSADQQWAGSFVSPSRIVPGQHRAAPGQHTGVAELGELLLSGEK